MKNISLKNKKQFLKQGIEDFFLDSVCTVNPNNKKQLQKNDDYDQAGALVSIHDLTKKIIASDEILFSTKKLNNGRGDVVRKQPSLCSEFELYCRDYSFVEDIKSIIFTIHRFSPYVEIFMKVFENSQSKRKLHRFNNLGYRLKDVIEKVEILNGLICSIRSEYKSEDFNKAAKVFKSVMTQNYKSLNNYIDKLFEAHSRILVLRIDFAYARDTTISPQMESYDECIKQEYSQAKKDFKRLLDNRRSNKKIFGHLLGYAWKLEYTVKKGFHFHTFFFFNGSKVHQESRAMMIGQYWEANITKSKGYYWNCNANKGQYEQLGIGMINHNDTELRNGLKLAAGYLTKSDQFARLDPEKFNDRTFGRGEMPKSPSKQGRPRKNTIRHNRGDYTF